MPAPLRRVSTFHLNGTDNIGAESSWTLVVSNEEKDVVTIALHWKGKTSPTHVFEVGASDFAAMSDAFTEQEVRRGQ